MPLKIHQILVTIIYITVFIVLNQPSFCFVFYLEMPKIVPGCIFAIYSKEIHSEGLWYRVKALKVKGDTAHIEYLDYGDTGHVPTSNLRSIPSRFLELPFQVCSMILAHFSFICWLIFYIVWRMFLFDLLWSWWIERFSYDLKMKMREQNRHNKRTEIERFDWFIERTQTRVAFG